MKSLVRLYTRSLSRISGNSDATQLDGAAGKAGAARGNFIPEVRRAVRRVIPATAMLAVMGFGSVALATAQSATLFYWTTPLGGGVLNGPESVAVDGSGNVYAITFSADGGQPTKAIEIPASDPTCSTPSDCLQVASNFTWAAPFGGTEDPQSIAVDSSGNVFLSSGIQLIKVPPTDITCNTPGDCVQLAEDTSGFASPPTVDPSGNVYIAVAIPDAGGGEVVKYTASNGYVPSTLFTWGENAIYVGTIAVDASGNVWLTEPYGGDNAILEYTPSGGVYTLGTTVTVGQPEEVVVDASGNLYVSTGNYTLFKETLSDGSYTESYLTDEQTVGAFALDGNGNIYFPGGHYVYEMHKGPVNFGSVNVGSSVTIPLTFSVPTSTNLFGSAELTQGATGLDFTEDTSATNYGGPVGGFYNGIVGGCLNDNYPNFWNTGICTMYLKFTPAKSGTRFGAQTIVTNTGSLLGTTYVQGVGVAPQAVIYPGTESTLFNSSTNGLSNPTGLAVDSIGNVYITDTGNSRVLKETLSGGSFTQSVVAGSLSAPYGVALDGAGDLYVAEQGSSLVEELSLSSGSYSACCTVANSATNGLTSPYDVAVDGAGDVYIADTGNNRVLMETLSSGSYTQTTIGSGLESPEGVAVDSSGNVYIADFGNNAVFKETLSGGSYTQSAIGSGLSHPAGVAVDGAGNVYVADTGNNRILLEAYSNGVYTQSVLLSSGLSDPNAVALDGKGNLYIADSGNNRVLKLDVADPQTLSFATTTVGETSSDSPQTAMLLNIGNATLTIPNPGSGTNPSVPADFAVGNAASDCDLVRPDSFFPGSLAAGTSCLLPISFEPTTTGALSESLVFTDNNLNGSSATNTIYLDGTGQTLPTATLSGTSLAYGNQAVGTWSASQSVTLTNNGTATLSITSIEVTGTDASSFGFANTCGTSLAGGATCTIHGHFGPLASGPLTANVTIIDNASGSPQTISLSGTGQTPPTATLSGTSLAYGNQTIGTASASQSVTLTNNGAATLNITSIEVTGTDASSFVFASTCGSTLAGGANCTIHGHFGPLASGPLTANVTITDSASGSPQTISLSGTGQTPPTATLSGTSLTYGNQTIGTASASQSVTLTNNGTATLSITSIEVTGTDASSFVFANTCGATLAGGANCTIHGHFGPLGSGPLTANVTIIDNASGSPQTISLSGTGQTPPTATLSGTSLAYGNQTIGTASASQSVTLTNNGTATLNITSIEVTGTDASSFVFANTCGATLAGGANCSIHGHFGPLASGPLTANVTIIDNASGSPQTISLSGTGQTPPTATLSGTSLTYGTQTIGTASASQSVTLTNNGAATLNITSIEVTGTDASSFVFANTCGTSLAGGANCSIHGHFGPLASGPLSANVTIIDNASGSPQTISLSGTGQTPPTATLSGTSLTYGTQTIGTWSASQSVTLTNNGAATLSITSIEVTGTDASSFGFANTCGTSLASGANCSIHGHFGPLASGPLTANITITDNASGSPQTISLSGTGQTP